MAEPVQIIPGQALTDAQRIALGEENMRITEEAHKMAADRRAFDDSENTPVYISIALSISEKMARIPTTDGQGNPIEEIQN